MVMSEPVQASGPKKRVGIIGAGCAGLQAIRALRAAGHEAIAFEKGPTVGGLWRENYASYGVQVPQQLFEFPDFPISPAQTAASDLTAQTYPDGASVQKYIEAYADHFGLRPHVVLNVEVTGLTRRADGKPGWTFSVARAGTGKALPTQSFDYAIVCTGMYSTPNLPAYDGAKAFEAAGGTLIHSSKYLSSKIATAKNVVVVGGAKSAIDIAIDAKNAGKAATSTLLCRTKHWGVPRLIAGLIPFQYVFLSRFGQLLVSLFKGPWPESAIDPKANGAHEGSAAPLIGLLHFFLTFPLGGLMRIIFGLVELIFGIQLSQLGTCIFE